MLSYIIMNIIIFIFSYYNSQEKLIIAFDFYHIAMNHDFQSTVNNLIQYIKVESWKYCRKCYSVEPNKMMPNFGKQKMTFITNYICQKGRYSVLSSN